MNVLVNCGPLKEGGGQNVALNFIYSIVEQKNSNVEFVFLVVKGSRVESLVKSSGFEYILVPRKPLLRIMFELIKGRQICNTLHVDIIYSYFGFGFFPTNIPQVSGAADSNLFFPEVDFWVGYRGLERYKKILIDKYRIWGLKRSAGVIFENETLEERGRRMFSLRNTVYIKPSFNVPSQAAVFEPFSWATQCDGIGLFLCGWQLNKNIMMIPKLAFEAKKRGIHFHFLLTAPEDGSKLHLLFKREIEKFDVEDSVHIIGPVNKEALSSLYNQVRCVFLLSLLESFSNNIIEAWFFERPLIIADEEWARSICGDAALYVNRGCPEEIVDAIELVCRRDPLVLSVLDASSLLLKTHPTSDEKAKKELEFLTYVKSIY